jgi:hypothetical protein
MDHSAQSSSSSAMLDITVAVLSGFGIDHYAVGFSAIALRHNVVA